MSASDGFSVDEIGFIHLHLHTAFSLREGALTVARVLALAEQDKMPALAVTDTNNFFGGLEFSEKAAKAGLQPIPGVQLTVDFGDASQSGSSEEGRGHIVVIAKSEEGYANLMRLASRAHLGPTLGDAPHVTLEALAAHSGELIAFTGGPEGGLDMLLARGRPEQAGARLAALERLFDGRLYVELQRHGLDQERRVEPQLLDLAFRRGLPLVATNEPFFATTEDFEAHDALLCIAGGTVTGVVERRRLSPQHYFKTRREMLDLFADLREATDATVEIARRVAVRPLKRKPVMPRFMRDGEGEGEALETIEARELRRQAREGLEARLEAHPPAPGLTRENYDARLEFELDTIEKMRFPGYFLIVSDFIKYAKSKGIPVGPGRGSGAGSLVAYALTITDLDPLRFGLFFERFLNPERMSMPDFDVDFCQTRRGEVIDYVRDRYGAERVAQIITFGSFLARGVLRSVGRVLEMPLGQVDKLAKLVPRERPFDRRMLFLFRLQEILRLQQRERRRR